MARVLKGFHSGRNTRSSVMVHFVPEFVRHIVLTSESTFTYTLNVNFFVLLLMDRTDRQTNGRMEQCNAFLANG